MWRGNNNLNYLVKNIRLQSILEEYLCPCHACVNYNCGKYEDTHKV